MQPLPPLAGAHPLVAGVCLDENGDPQLILDPVALGDVLAGAVHHRGASALVTVALVWPFARHYFILHGESPAFSAR